MPRRLSPEERSVWRRVTATVRRSGKDGPADSREASENPVKTLSVVGSARSSALPATAKSTQKSAERLAIANTLDGGWDKRIAKGALEPEITIDLHGETLASAHARLNRSLAAAIRSEARIILLITGKPARDNPRLPPVSRGVIRASVADWLAASSHAAKIAAIRNAHPRHGGAGALYLILKRAR